MDATKRIMYAVEFIHGNTCASVGWHPEFYETPAEARDAILAWTYTPNVQLVRPVKVEAVTLEGGDELGAA